MNKRQLNELKFESDLHGGIDGAILKELNELDKEGRIKPHFSMMPLLFMIGDGISFSEKEYEEYREEYE